MIIYNVTSKIAYLPQVMAESEATGYQLTRLLDVDDREGPTYALLLVFPMRQSLIEYRSAVLPGHEKLIKEKWGESVLSFGTTLDVVLKG